MKDTDDYDIDDFGEEEVYELESNKKAIADEISSKRDARIEIEKKLELKQLKKLTEDAYYDSIFD